MVTIARHKMVLDISIFKAFRRSRNCYQYVYAIAQSEFFLARGYIKTYICHIIVDKYSSTSCQLHFAIFEVRNDYFYFDTYLTPGFLYLDPFFDFRGLFEIGKHQIVLRASFYCILRCHVDLNFELIPFQNTIVFYTIDDIDLRQKV